ncbi:hypothetical protein KR044_004531, partial [Drosophila immigrans]
DTVSVVMRGNIDLIATIHPQQSASAALIEVTVELFNTASNKTAWKSKVWQVYIEDEDSPELFWMRHRFELGDDMSRAFVSDVIMGRGIRAWGNLDTTLQLTLLNLRKTAVGMGVTIDANPFNESISVWLGLLLLIFLYILIGFDIADRTFAALITASSSIGVLCMLGERPTLPEIVAWIDMDTLMLLFGMMVMMSILSETGLFDYMTVFAYQLSKGHIWRLLFYLYAIAAILSAFLDNVTIVLLMVPVTIRLCEMLAINTIIVLISLTLFSNIGGTLTPVGDPPNAIIALNPFIYKSGVRFGNFTLHMFPGVLVSMMLAFVMIYYMTRNKLEDSGGQLLRSIAALEKQAENNKDTQYSPIILKHIEVLKDRLKAETAQSPKNHSDFEDTLAELKTHKRIRDKPLLIKCGIAALFFMLSLIPLFEGTMLSWSAVLATLLLLILVDRPNVDSLLQRVEWSSLIFFAALFVFMESLVRMRLIDCISGIITDIIMSMDKDSQMLVGILMVLWISALASAFVDNIPITTLLIKLVIRLATNHSMNLSLHPLIWALSFGACFGGNGTLIGATANVVAVGIAKQHGYDISFRLFLIIGFPIMILTVVVASIYLLIAHCLFTWH